MRHSQASRSWESSIVTRSTIVPHRGPRVPPPRRDEVAGPAGSPAARGPRVPVRSAFNFNRRSNRTFKPAARAEVRPCDASRGSYSRRSPARSVPPAARDRRPIVRITNSSVVSILARLYRLVLVQCHFDLRSGPLARAPATVPQRTTVPLDYDFDTLASPLPALTTDPDLPYTCQRRHEN